MESKTEMANRKVVPSTWKSLYRQAISFYQAGLYAQSAELFKDLLNGPGLKGHLARYYYSRACRQEGEQLMSQGKSHLAAEYFKKALGSNPNCPTLLSFLAQCYTKQGRYVEAGEQFGVLAEISETGDQARLKEALSYYLAGRTDDAITALQTLAKRNPQCFDVSFQLGTILASEGEVDQSIRYLTTACMLRPELPETHQRLALAHAAQGHIVEALHHLQEAHKLDPGNNWTLTHLTMGINQAKQFGIDVDIDIVTLDEAESHFACGPLDQLAELITEDAEFVTAFLDLPRSELDEQIFSALLEILMEALERHPQYADLRYACGCVYQRLGQTDKALEQTQEALSINPRFVNALIHLAKLYMQCDRHQQAIDRLQAAIANGANYADVHYTLGRLYHQLGFLDQARSSYRRALSINSEYAEAREALASLAA